MPRRARLFDHAVPVICAFFAVTVLLPGATPAQQTITTPDGKTIMLPAGVDPSQVLGGGFQSGRVPSGGPAQTPGKPQQAPKGGKPGEKPGGKPEDKKDGAKKDGEAEKKGGPVTRPNEPPQPPDMKELEAKLTDGKLFFQFRNQPWENVLQWYAREAKLSLDWQELPGDYINLQTHRPHTLEQTGDLLNRALLMRGYTMLQQEEVLIVSKVENINPSLVPRVRAEELGDLPPHKFVRASFMLTWLLAEEVHTEFQSMLSKNGKLTPLQSTNRIEAMDAAANLYDIYNIIQQEQSSTAMENLAREFVLQHARASSVKQQLEVFLGMSSGGASSRSMSSSRDAARMMQQQMQQMQQQMQQQMRNAQKSGGSAGASRKPRPDNVYLVSNDRSNSLIVHAQPNKMAIIESFIRRVDVKNEDADYQRLENRVKVFRLASLSPAELVASLEAMDVLEPRTQLQVDAENNAIIAYASVADQYVINELISRLDGSERTFEVIELRRLDAESVAGSIKFLMGADEEDSNNNRNRYYGFDYYGRSQQKKSNDKMRVGANVQDNQVLLWANPIEMEEVQKLLVKLGELPPEGGNPSTVRVIDASRQPETYEYLKRLKEQWELTSPNPLVIPDEAEFSDPNAPTETEEESTGEAAEEKTEEAADAPVADEVTQNADQGGSGGGAESSAATATTSQ